MKNFQVRLPDEMHARVAKEAKVREVSIADVIRDALELRLAVGSLIGSGGRMLYERPDGEKVEVVILGLSHLR